MQTLLQTSRDDCHSFFHVITFSNNLNDLLGCGDASGSVLVPRQDADVRPRLHPHLLDNLPPFPQQAPDVRPRHDQPRRHPLPPPPPSPPCSVLLLLVPAATTSSVELLVVDDPLVDHQQRLLRG